MITELWELDSFESQIINPTLSTNYRNLGLFLVDIGYCSKPAAKKAVLMLSTSDSSNVPMVIGYDGKRLQVFFILAQNIFKVKLTMIYALHMKTLLKLLAHVQRL